MMKLVNISKKYENKIVLNNVSYEFSNTGFYFLTGRSGSGKSTLLNIIGNLEKPSAGSISSDLNVSYVFQDANLFSDLTVIENVMLVGIDANKASEILSSINMLDLKDKKVSLLSGGERQRVSIARALAMDSNLILLDEPTGNLDDENSRIILNILKEISKNRLIIMATHDIEYANEYADIILKVNNGNLEEEIANEIVPAEVNKVLDSKNIFSFKYQNLYASRLIKSRPVKYTITLILSTLSLVLLFFILCVIFYDETSVISNAIKTDNRSYYSVSKDYYNSMTDENVEYCVGNKFEEDLKAIGVTEIEHVANCSMNQDYSFSLIVDDTDYDGVIITDFISECLFGSENPSADNIDLSVNSHEINLKITDVIMTSCTEFYNNYFRDEEFRSNHYDDYNYFYGLARISKKTYLKFFEDSVRLRGTNFTDEEMTYSAYINTYCNFSYSSALTGNEICVSENFYNKNKKIDTIPGTFTFKDLYGSKNKVLYEKYYNIYDTISEVNLIGVVDDNTYDVYVSQDIYNNIIKDYYLYSFKGFCVTDDVNVDSLHSNGFKIADSDIATVYSLSDIFNKTVRIVFVVVGVIITLVSSLSLYFSVAGFLDKKSKEFFIMKCLNIPLKRIINVFIIYTSLVICLGLILSFIFGNIGIILLNIYMKKEVFDIVFNPFVVDYKIYLFSVSLVLLIICLILIGPMIKLKRIDGITLVKQNL